MSATRFNSPPDRPFGLAPNLLSLVDIEPWMEALLWSDAEEPEQIMFLGWPHYGRDIRPYLLAVGDNGEYADPEKETLVLIMRIVRRSNRANRANPAKRVSAAGLGLCTDIFGDWDQVHCCTSINE
ncbi:MAG: hypothetical protein ABI397_02395 [Candidatus Saccharimonas sp.]